MEKAIIGKKVGMTQIFDADGKVIPVTLIEAGPCTVVQKKTEEKDGYSAVQLGYGDEGDRVDVTGISKGHGYQGVIKRHGAHRLKESHGTGPVHRHAGSMGPATDPSRIFKGKIGAGQMGNEQVTVLNLDVVKVDTELGLIAVRGAIPGPKGGIVTVRNSVINVKEKGAAAGISSNPQKASARVNPQTRPSSTRWSRTTWPTAGRAPRAP